MTLHERGRVLVIDDHHDTADSVAMLAHAWGYSVRAAYDGVRGLALLSEFQPHIMLIDLALPSMDGLSLVREVRSRTGRERPMLVAITGYGDDEHRRAAHDAGFDFFFIKPLDPDALERLLAELINRRFAQATRAGNVSGG